MNSTPVPSPIGLPERLTLEVASATLAKLQAVLQAQAGPTVELDAAGMREFDTSAVAVLLALHRGLHQQGKVLAVKHWPQRLRDLVALYGVDSLLPA